MTWNFSGFPSTGASIALTATVNGTMYTTTYNIFTSSGSYSGPINGATGDTVTASASWTVAGGGSVSAGPVTLSGCATPPPPPCPQGTKANFRWHYSANGSSGSWSGTQSAVCPHSLTMGPQAMEGDLKVSPGTTLEAGYDFTVPGNHASFSLTVGDPQVVFAVACVSARRRRRPRSP